MNRIFGASCLVFYKEIFHYRLKNKCYRDAEKLSMTLFAAGKLYLRDHVCVSLCFVRICLSAFFLLFFVPLRHWFVCGYLHVAYFLFN